MFCTGPTRAAKARQKSLELAQQIKEPLKERPLKFVLFESPFTSVLTFSRGHPSLVLLAATEWVRFVLWGWGGWSS